VSPNKSKEDSLTESDEDSSKENVYIQDENQISDRFQKLIK